MKRVLIIFFFFNMLFVHHHSFAQYGCELMGINKSIIEFWSVSENVCYVKVDGLDITDDCVYSFEYDNAPFLNIEQTKGDEIKITATHLNYYNFVEQVVAVISDGNPMYPPKIKVKIRVGGKVSGSANSINVNESPGIFSNVSESLYAESYQWEKVIVGSEWEDIPDATSLTYNCPVLSESTRFRRKAFKLENNETLTAYSNVIEIVVNEPGNQLPENYTINHNNNYILSITPQIAVRDYTAMFSLPLSQQRASVRYFDGLGRPKQNIAILSSPDGKDIVQPIVYDEFDREKYQLLPYRSGTSGGKIQSTPNMNDYSSSAHYLFYTNSDNGVVNDAYPYSETIFDGSPLNRVVEQGSPGAVWQPGSGHTHRISYESNWAYEVILFSVNNDALENQGYYQTNQLYKTVSKDENWTRGVAHTTEEFRDKQGLLVLKRTYLNNNGIVLDTYYVYDDFGLLRYVLPPKAFEVGPTSITSSELTQLCYQYKYDGRKRMTHKKLPGADWVYMVYDKRDRLVATQDGFLGKYKNWMFTKYDALNRPILTGIYHNSSSLDEVQGTVDNYTGTNLYEERGPGALGYTIRSFPTSGISEYLSANFYDTYPDFGPEYDFDEFGKIDNYTGDNGELYFTGTKGQLTGSIVKMLGRLHYLETCYYYDDKYRNTQTVSGNYQNGISITSTKYDFVGKVLETRMEQDVELNEEYSDMISHTYNTYDHAGRLLQIDHMIEDHLTNNRISLAKMSYNELGEMIEKNLHENIQSIDYNYNIRGWLTSINNSTLSNETEDANPDLFGMELNYNNIHTSLNQSSDRQYNGNISSVVWKHAEEASQKAYGFSYDALNRIKKADYGQSADSWINNTFDVAGKNGENAIRYDLNGNILSLGRKGANDTYKSNFSYFYKGNQLKSMNRNGDTANPAHTHYQYTENGNMKRDEFKAMNVYYNELNLPSIVRFDNGKMVKYYYDATGVKHRKEVLNNNVVIETVDYVGEVIYKNGEFDYLLTGEGRVTKPSGGFVYEYHLKDHLGNTRVAFEATGGEAIVKQKSDYYPFGLRFDGYLNNDNKYLYNGKELQDETDWLDYGARMYDPSLGRFMTLDPKAEIYNYQSPFAYAANNPIRYIDVLGMGPGDPPVGTTQIYASLNLSFGPQLGFKLGIFKLAGRVANVDRRIKVGLEITPKGDVKFLFDSNSKNVDYELKASAEFASKSIIKESGTDEHKVFAEKKTTTKKGLVKEVVSEKLGEETTTESTAFEVGIGANAVIVGAEVNVGFDHIVSSETTSDTQNNTGTTTKREEEIK